MEDGSTVSGFDFGKRKNQIVGCKLQVDSQHIDGYRIVNWDVIDYGDRPLADVVEALSHDSSPLFDSDWHVLETQIVKTGRFVMNTFCYGLSYALLGKLAPQSPGQVIFMSPISKFALDPDRMERPGVPDKKLSYVQRKRWAVRLCEKLVVNQSTEMRAVMDVKKRDDLADAFLYARMFIAEYLTSRLKIKAHFQ